MFCLGGFCLGGFWQGGFLSRGFLSGGLCPGGFCLGGFCPRTTSNAPNIRVRQSRYIYCLLQVAIELILISLLLVIYRNGTR